MTSEERELALVLAAEARELFDDAEPRLIALRQSSSKAGAADDINAVFRSFHSVKGAAATMGFEQIARLTHAAESLLAVFRKGSAQLDGNSLELLLQALDLARQLLATIEEGKSDAHLADGVDSLRKKLGDAQQAVTGAPPTAAVVNAPSPAAPADPAPKAPEPAPAPGAPPVAKAAAIVDSGLSTAGFAQQFTQEAEEQLAKAEASLLAAEASPGSAAPLAEAFRAVHSFKGNCGFMGHALLESFAHKAETLLDLARSNPATPMAPALGVLLKAVDALRNGVSEASTRGAASGAGFADLEEQLESAALVLKGGMAPAPAAPSAPPGAASPTPAAPAPAAPAAKAPSAGPPAPEAAKAAPGPEASAAPVQRQDIRVDLLKLDALVNLVGELVIAEAMVTDHPIINRAEDETLARAIHLLRRVSLDLQDVAMSVRMVPLAGAFRKLVRVVHDVQQKVGKKVRLEVIGEETEVDKSVLEQLSDPLVHLVRNSIDHGLESPQERAAAGKREEGTVTVEARHEGGEVLVIVRDDGRGLDRARIVAKACERGILTPQAAEKLSEQQAFALIFEPGFSTAEKVTDVSGRGVGMDVVRKNIERLQGTVELRSKQGLGTSVIMHIPLTLAIIDGMLVRVGQARYTLPLLSIRESLRPTEEQITKTPDGQEVARIREKLIPVLRLHEIFNRTPERLKLHEGILVVVEANGQMVGLFADELLGQQQAVIKGLSSYLGRSRGVSGCTILGNGEVSLILDVNALLGLAHARA